MEQGSVDAAVMLDPGGDLAAGQATRTCKILADTRTQKDTLDVFGGEYPGGALYTKSAWIASHPKETQALTNAIVETLKWIHSHTPEEIMAKMPEEIVGKNKALYLAALKNTIPMYSTTGRMDPKGAKPCSPCSARFAGGRQGQDRRQQDLHQQVRREGEDDRRKPARIVAP